MATAIVVWVILLGAYALKAVRHFSSLKAEFQHPVQGATPALLAIATLLIGMGILPYSRILGFFLIVAALAWHIAFSLWHTGMFWKGARNLVETTPALYLPTVAGNLTSAAALGALGSPAWGWLFFGAGVFSWLTLESIIIQRISHGPEISPAQRPLLGIQFAPPAVCAMSCTKPARPLDQNAKFSSLLTALDMTRSHSL